jgi:flagellar M-ring protein FliF
MPAPLAQILEVWGRLKTGQQIALIGAVVSTIAVIGALVYFGSRPEYGVLFSDLKPADAQSIIDKLKSSNVPYKVTNGGTVISIPADKVPELRLEMASAGVISGGHVGFDIFDKSNFGATDFAQQVNYQRALEGELARTLEAMDEVESARVHVSRRRESVFVEKDERAKASVVLRIRQGRELSRERTESVVNLLSSAVEGLDPADVAVLDTRGRVLSAPRAGGGTGWADAGTFRSHFEARNRLESETSARIISLLEPITGIGRVRADVAADLNFDHVEQTEERFDPKSSVIRAQQSMQQSRNLGGAGGVAGTRSNDGTAAAAATPTPMSTAGDQGSSTSTQYEIDRTIKKTVGTGSGRLNRLSVSVVVDHKSVNGKPVPRGAEELKQMQEVVAAAVGINPTRGDQIVVQSIPFDMQPVEVKNPTWVDQYRDLIQTGIKYGLLLLATVLVILFVVRPVKKTIRAAIAPPEQLALNSAGGAAALLSGDAAAVLGGGVAGALSAGDVAGMVKDNPKTVSELEAELMAEIEREMAAGAPDVKRAHLIKKTIQEQVKDNPEMIAATLRSWLKDK